MQLIALRKQLPRHYKASRAIIREAVKRSEVTLGQLHIEEYVDAKILITNYNSGNFMEKVARRQNPKAMLGQSTHVRLNPN